MQTNDIINAKLNALIKDECESLFEYLDDPKCVAATLARIAGMVDLAERLKETNTDFMPNKDEVV